MTGLADVHLALAAGERAALVDVAVEAERLGFGGVWVAEGPSRDAFSLLTEIALRTSKAELGTGIVNIYGRSATALAQAAASLAECAPGRRVHLGLGTGSRILIERTYGVPYERPFARMREVLDAVRRALTGERLRVPGRDRVDLYVAGLSGRMRTIAGEAADGWLPIWPSRRTFTTALAGSVAEAAAAAGRTPPAVAAYVYTCAGADEEAALASLRRALAWYMVNAGSAYANLFRAYGYESVVDSVTEAWRAGDRDAARAAIPEEVVRDLAVLGPATTVPDQLDELRKLGIAHPVLRFPDDLGAGEITAMLRDIAAAYSDTGRPSYADLPVHERTGARHAWEVFGPDDQLGTLNWLTPDAVAAAIRTVRHGQVVNLSLPLTEPGGLAWQRPQLRHTVDRNRSGRDDHLDSFYLQASSQWDGLAHVRYREFGYYGGREEADLDAGALGIDTFAEHGIVGRGVLADVAAWRAAQGKPIDARAREPITPAMLDAVLGWQGATVSPGDILLVRTGWLRWYRALDEPGLAAVRGTMMEMAAPGLAPGAATAAWLWDQRVAAVAADNPALEALPTVREEGFLHRLLIPLLGMPIGELWDLDRLGEACRAQGRYAFLLTSVPLNLPGGVGSPANACAIF